MLEESYELKSSLFFLQTDKKIKSKQTGKILIICTSVNACSVP